MPKALEYIGFGFGFVRCSSPSFVSRYKNTSFVDLVSKSSGNPNQMLNDLAAPARAAAAAAELNDLTLNTSEIVNVVEGLIFPDFQVTSGKHEVEWLTTFVDQFKFGTIALACNNQ